MIFQHPTDQNGLSSANDIKLRQELRERLLSLNYHAFAWVMIHLLERLGYVELRPVGRTSFFGHNSHGGYDIEAKLPFALGERRVIIQVKHYDSQMVFRRAVDELRGAILRVGASEGVILSTGPIAPSLKRKEGVTALAPAVPGIAPVQVVDGDELLDLCILHGIGVTPSSSQTQELSLLIDTAYFDAMEKFHTGASRTSEQSSTPRFLLTVGVKKLGRQQSSGDRSKEQPEQVTTVLL